MSNITPAELLHRLQQLFPNLQRVTQDEWQNFMDTEWPFNEDTTGVVEVDWGNTTEYPEATWRNATEADIGDTPIDARFSNCEFDDEKTIHHTGKLIGYRKTYEDIYWIDDDEDDWEYCQVRVTPDIGNPISTFNLGPNKSCLLFMGGKWIEGIKSGLSGDPEFFSEGETTVWDKANQPTHWKPMPNIEDDGTEHDDD
jgi:hypothetical protein